MFSEDFEEKIVEQFLVISFVYGVQIKIETLCYIHHFHIDHNACTFFTNHCFQYFSWVVMQNLGVNMVH